MIDHNFIYLAGFLSLFGNGGYLIEAFLGRIKPNRVTFFGWTLTTFVILLGQLSKGVGIQAIITGVGFLTCFLVLLTAIVNKKAYWKLVFFDFSCGVISIIGLLLWIITKEGNLAIVFGLVADGTALLPTVVKTYLHPETEVAWPWFSSSLSGLVTLLVISKWEFAYYSFPLYVFLSELLVFLLIIFKKKKRK